MLFTSYRLATLYLLLLFSEAFSLLLGKMLVENKMKSFSFRELPNGSLQKQRNSLNVSAGKH